jgi:hypothetical protein
MSVLSITFTGEDGRPLTALHTVLVICSHVHTPSSKKKRRMCSTHEFPLPNQDSPPSIHQSNILRPLFEHPPSSHLLTSHKNLQTSRSTERSARTDQGDNRLRSGEKECEGREKSSPYSETFPAGQVYYKISSRHYRHCVKTEKEKEAPGPTSRTLSTRAGSRSGAFGYKQ